MWRARTAAMNHAARGAAAMRPAGRLRSWRGMPKEFVKMSGANSAYLGIL